ncbi:hypothetical protein CDAR_70301 [Caerostris darwini]|uniref:Uncharacterized protein n=1 Tax=Caerostris darwini TaxID=1538125 RepID=A0AAV4PVI1_9ARAC|nr:hypothetical protein CDAR_70301 [Caerostris darwini]
MALKNSILSTRHSHPKHYAMYRDFGKFCRRTNAECDKPSQPNPSTPLPVPVSHRTWKCNIPRKTNGNVSNNPTVFYANHADPKWSTSGAFLKKKKNS